MVFDLLLFAVPSPSFFLFPCVVALFAALLCLLSFFSRRASFVNLFGLVVSTSHHCHCLPVLACAFMVLLAFIRVGPLRWFWIFCFAIDVCGGSSTFHLFSRTACLFSICPVVWIFVFVVARMCFCYFVLASLRYFCCVIRTIVMDFLFVVHDCARHASLEKQAVPFLGVVLSGLSGIGFPV